MRAFMHEVKATGSIPDSHKSHDHLNEQKDVPLDEDRLKRWNERFSSLRREWKEREGVEVVWGLVDGFLLYWDSVRVVFYCGQGRPYIDSRK
jgi:nicotinamide/nicotinate riboside kinase